MNWSEQVFQYCERGTNPAFLAEPANAFSNLAFIVAAGVALAHLLQHPRAERTHSQALMIGLVVVIGTGSFLFHTFATQWARIADIAPIGLFMLTYLAIALVRYLDVSAGMACVGTLFFAIAIALGATANCGTDPFGISIGSAGARCLNGSLGYLPAMLALLGIGGLMRHRRHPAAWHILGAGIIFTGAIILRTADKLACPIVQIAGRDFGTHSLWHCLNALTLYLLLIACIDHGAHGRTRVVGDKSHSAD